MPFEPGTSGNKNGRPKGSKNRFTGDLKSRFLDAFQNLEDDQKSMSFVEWIKSDPDRQGTFYSLISKLLPKEISATVSVSVERYSFGNGPVPADVMRSYITELVSVQVMSAKLKEKMLRHIRGEWRPQSITLKGLRESSRRLNQEQAIPVKALPVKAVKAVQKPEGPQAVAPKKKSPKEKKKKPPVDLELEKKKARLAELKKELARCPD